MNPVMEQMPESKRTSELEAALSGLEVKDMGGLADALVSSYALKGEAETMKGKLGDLESKMVGMVSVPGVSASDEDRRTFDSLVGVPGSAAGYGITSMSNEAGNSMLEAFRESGVRKDVAIKLAAKMEGLNTKAIETQNTNVATKLTAVKAALGDKGYELAQKGAEAMFPGDEMASTREKYLSDPDALPGIAKVGRATIETPRLFQSSAKGSGASLYPSMEKRGMK